MFTAWLVPEASAVTMKASAAPALLLSTVGCTSIEPASEATTVAVVGIWQVLAMPGAGSEPKVVVVHASAPVIAFCAHLSPLPNRTVAEAGSHAAPPSLATHFQPVESVVASATALGCSVIWPSPPPAPRADSAAVGSEPPPPPHPASTAAATAVSTPPTDLARSCIIRISAPGLVVSERGRPLPALAMHPVRRLNEWRDGLFAAAGRAGAASSHAVPRDRPAWAGPGDRTVGCLWHDWRDPDTSGRTWSPPHHLGPAMA